MPRREYPVGCDIVPCLESVRGTPFESPFLLGSFHNKTVIKISRIACEVKLQLPGIRAREIHLHSFCDITVTEFGDRTADKQRFSPLGMVVDI